MKNLKSLLVIILAFFLVVTFCFPALGAKTIKQGGLLTVIIVVAVMVFMGVAWGIAFTLFHNLFFSSGTWTFLYSDSLIRLFPEQFWFDFGMLWTGLILLGGIILALTGYILGRAWE